MKIRRYFISSKLGVQGSRDGLCVKLTGALSKLSSGRFISSIRNLETEEVSTVSFVDVCGRGVYCFGGVTKTNVLLGMLPGDSPRQVSSDAAAGTEQIRDRTLKSYYRQQKSTPHYPTMNPQSSTSPAHGPFYANQNYFPTELSSEHFRLA